MGGNGIGGPPTATATGSGTGGRPTATVTGSGAGQVRTTSVDIDVVLQENTPYLYRAYPVEGGTHVVGTEPDDAARGPFSKTILACANWVARPIWCG